MEAKKRKKSSEYSFKGVRVYASAEPLADGMRPYRMVFESAETSFIYAEVVLLNKARRKWEADMTITCFRLTPQGKEEFAKASCKKTVRSTDETIFFREGWGSDEPGHIWKRGDYRVEVVLNGEQAGVTHFYVEDSGVVSQEHNPYFDLINIELYEGGKSGVSLGNRKYLKTFNADTTRYVWAEVSIENLLSRSWFCELSFNFFNESKDLKGRDTELKLVKPHEREVNLQLGLGDEQPGSWQKGRYTLEIRFMGKLVGMILFECGEEEREGSNPVFHEDALQLLNEEESSEKAPVKHNQEAQKDFYKMVGLAQVKKQVKDYLNYLQFLKIRQERGFKEQDKLPLHAVFTGNPGTGKTTVARLLGKVYQQMGLLSSDTFYEVGRVELVGQYIGQTAPKVRDVIENARGGVLFIDEAYSLARNEKDDKDYGNEVIEILVKELSDGPGDIAIFVAGYPAEMETFLKSNPGLRSRFRNHFHFSDYTPDELLQISKRFSKENEISYTEKAMEYLNDYLTKAYKNRDKSFGNARMVKKIVEDTKVAMANRLMNNPERLPEMSDYRLKTARIEDLKKVLSTTQPQQPELKINEPELNEGLQDLHNLTGLKTVKMKVQELVELVRFYRQANFNTVRRFSMHTVFKGNPGTGKTTVARIIGKIYNALGILERGHLIECSRQDLVAGYVGQTAIKTKEMLNRAMGGILFIDEAYALFSGEGKEDFGKEAIETILKAMEDERGKFAVIMAGYTNEMDKLLHMNPGLKSRFDHEIYFDDYSHEELMTIAHNMFRTEGLFMHPAAEAALGQTLAKLGGVKSRFNGNARTVRRLTEESARQQHLRIARIATDKRTKKLMRTVLKADIDKVDLETLSIKPADRPIGFKNSSS